LNPTDSDRETALVKGTIIAVLELELYIMYTCACLGNKVTSASLVTGIADILLQAATANPDYNDASAASAGNATTLAGSALGEGMVSLVCLASLEGPALTLSSPASILVQQRYVGRPAVEAAVRALLPQLSSPAGVVLFLYSLVGLSVCLPLLLLLLLL
jgi:hypothetical protein